MKTNNSRVLLLCTLVMIPGCAGGGAVNNTNHHGKAIVLKSIKNPDRTITNVFYSEGKETAQQVRGKDDDIIKTTGTIPDGTVKEYYDNGNLKEISTYKNNRREGLSKWYYEDGIVQAERNYKDDKLDGTEKWYYTSGALATEYNYTNGKLEGLSRLYWGNGKLKAEENYKNGLRDGINKQYHDSGELRFIYTFKNGKIIKKETYNKGGKLMGEQIF